MRKNRLFNGVAKALGVVMAISAAVTPLAGCQKTVISNENTPLMLAMEKPDEVFNPFFYTSGADGEVVGQTQVGMLTSDSKGELVAGWDEACVALDYSVVTTGNRNNMATDNDYENFYTDYYFAIKDDVKFSDGELLTINDVLFNIYMYLDPAYTGSSTMYSVDIQGLKAYRTQSEDTGNQDASDGYFNTKAETRLNAIIEWADNKREGDWDQFDAYANDETDAATIKADILKAHDLFKEELQSDWNSAADAAKDYEKYVDRNGKKLITEGWQVFLYRYDILRIVPDQRDDEKNILNYKYEDANIYTGSKEEAAIIEYVHDSYFGEYTLAPKAYKTHLLNVITGYATASTLRSYVLSEVISKELAGEMKVPNVSGIKVLENQSSIKIDESGATRALKDKDGNDHNYDVINICINGVDPKAIQNFSFAVAPGHYYAADNWKNVDWKKNNFGVTFANTAFMEKVKAIQVPVGAGPYRPSKYTNSKPTDTIAKGDFCSSNMVYFERNDYFMLGAPKIRCLRYQVINSNSLYDALKQKQIDFASPSVTAEMVNNQLKPDSERITYTSTDNIGYGYIGINAQYINNIYVRRAIMTTLDPNMCMNYYGGSEYATVIYRPMSSTLTEYYPKDAQPVYPYDGTGEAALEWLSQANAVDGSDGVKRVDGKPLKYTFTLAGDSTDHPAMRMLENSSRILNRIGFDITVVNDSTALIKLASGTLTVWAAAWSSSSDPDMYQVYHKNSSATSTKAWGYNYLTSAACDSYQRNLVNDLSELIELGREYMLPSERVGYYHDALDLLMDLAVEFPTYQRQVFYVWRKGFFDESTMFTDDGPEDRKITPYRSPLSEIWNVSLNEG